MTEETPRAANFITQIIDGDLAAGRCGGVVTRFPPEPNGYLHIGHAKSICLNFGLARDYGGFCNLRFDDTNPAKEETEYVESIMRDVRWLGFEWHGEPKYSSDYFGRLYDFAVELIRKGLAYVDELGPDEIREYRGTLTVPGRESPWRNRPPEENLRLFEKMRDGGFAEGEACLRAKIDMASPFICMRDPVIYRVKIAGHHRTGDKWRVYPMYDFTHCISDALEGVTHSLCTLEFQDNRRLYDWVLEHITIDCRPRQYEFSRLNLEYSITSKRKLNLLVKEGVVDGWDDPRMTTISGMRRRGYPPAAVREFCRRVGVTRQDGTVEFSALESCVRENLNENAPRRMAVLRPLKLVVDGFPADRVETLDVPNHPLRPELGTRPVPFTRELYIERDDFRKEADKKFKRLAPGREIRLRHAYIVRAESWEEDENGEVTAVRCSLVPGSLGRDVEGHKPKGVVHWVSASLSLTAEVRLYGRLFSVPNPGAAEDFLAAVSRDSLTVVRDARIEPALRDAAPSEAFQFERTGYFCADSRDSAPGKPVFNLTVALKEDAGKAAA